MVLDNSLLRGAAVESIEQLVRRSRRAIGRRSPPRRRVWERRGIEVG
jgi:hypothetical protein